MIGGFVSLLLKIVILVYMIKLLLTLFNEEGDTIKMNIKSQKFDELGEVKYDEMKLVPMMQLYNATSFGKIPYDNETKRHITL